jgi:tetratricopeptide (TPR) repeat protein
MTMRTRYFTGRNDLLARLRQQLVERHRAALSGLGGVGKTQTAIEYAARHRADYPSGVFWVNAETTSGLTGGFVQIAAALGLPVAASNDQETVVKAVMKWLNGTSGWLLVLDNVDDRRTIQTFVPEDAEGHVLMTSREPIFAEVGIPRALEVRDLDGDEAVSFLLARTGREDAEPDDRAAAAELAAELGCLPLALEQAAAYTSETSAAFSVYLSAFRKRRVTLLEKSGGLVAHDSVAVTWRANFEAVERESAAAADVLRMSALLAPDAIPFKLFLDGSHVLGEPIAEALTDSDDLAMTEVLRPLARYSLIRSDASSRTFSVHRLVQDIVWEAVAESDRSALVERAVHALDAAFPSVEYANWQQCERLTAHIFSIAAWLQSYAAAPESAIRVLNRAGHYLRERGRSAEAQRLHERALSIAERAFGPEHRESATSLNYLASVYWDQALYGEARRIAERALRILERELGTDHPDVARSLNTLGLIHHEQGHYAEATPLHERAMVIRERAFGPDHADVARSRTNLAHVKLAQGRYREAHALYELSLKTWERAFGPDHPAISTALTNLGNVHYDSGRFAEALSLFERSLTISERTLGPDDPDLAIGLSNLASALIKQGRHSEALPLNERALTIWERTLGPDHPSLAFSLNGLAEAERHLGRYAEAEALFKRALTIRERVLGADHPDLSEGLTGLADLYAHIGRTGDAAALYQRALDIQERALGSNHPKVADTLVGLAVLRTESPRSDTFALYERALVIKESTFGDDDEQVVAIRDAIDALRSTM